MISIIILITNYRHTYININHFYSITRILDIPAYIFFLFERKSSINITYKGLIRGDILLYKKAIQYKM